jgi:uncharacterized glyoxalase superfamily protein PhnB
MVVADVAAAVDFLVSVFAATAPAPGGGPAQVRLGDSLVLISSTDARELVPAFLYVYVADVEATYARALAAGATSMEAPWDTPYGDFRAMVRDPSGNVFQLASPADTDRKGAH